MKFNFDNNKCSDFGLVVKHGNKDNVVLFFDEVQDAACYRANLFRTNAHYSCEGFVQQAKIIDEQKIHIQSTEYHITPQDRLNQNQNRVEQVLDTKWPAYKGDNLVWEDREPINFSCQINNHNYGRGEYKLKLVKQCSFDDVKFITSLEAQRNDLYINIDFLPCGDYFVILQAEGRDGKIIKEALPYYFKVELQVPINDVFKATKEAGRRASGSPSVLYGS